MKQYLETGQIVNVHGIAGEFKVKPWSNGPEYLTQFKRFYLSPDGEGRLDCERVRVHKEMVLVKVSGINTPEAAQKLRGKIIYIDRDDAELEDGEYFIQDLLGILVYDVDSGACLGKLTDISQTGANDVWHIERSGKTYLVPAIDEVVLDIDIEAKRAVIRPLKGIFDDED